MVLMMPLMMIMLICWIVPEIAAAKPWPQATGSSTRVTSILDYSMSDAWSLGLLLYRMMALSSMDAHNDETRQSLSDTYSSPLRIIVNQLLIADPTHRLSLIDADRMLQSLAVTYSLCLNCTRPVSPPSSVPVDTDSKHDPVGWVPDDEVTWCYLLLSLSILMWCCVDESPK
jgi:hypothetical protein